MGKLHQKTHGMGAEGHGEAGCQFLARATLLQYSLCSGRLHTVLEIHVF